VGPFVEAGHTITRPLKMHFKGRVMA